MARSSDEQQHILFLLLHDLIYFSRYGWGESVQSDIVIVGKHDALPEFIKILPGQLKALLGSELNLECEVSKIFMIQNIPN